jgi:hypothetical protein
VVARRIRRAMRFNDVRQFWILSRQSLAKTCSIRFIFVFA